MPSIGKRDRKKRRRQCTEYYRSALSQASFFFAPQIAGPDGPAALGGSNRAHPGGLPKKSYFTGPGFLEGLFKLDKLQRDHRAGSEMYSKSRYLSKLPEAFKPAVTSLQSWHFSTFLNIPFSGRVPAYGWLFRTFALLFFFWPDTEVCPWPNNAKQAGSRVCQVPPTLLLEPGESILFSSLTSNSQLTLVLTENIKKQIHHHCIEVAARFWTVGEDRCESAPIGRLHSILGPACKANWGWVL